jgi:hypothetical protein
MNSKVCGITPDSPNCTCESYHAIVRHLYKQALRWSISLVHVKKIKTSAAALLIVTYFLDLIENFKWTLSIAMTLSCGENPTAPLGLFGPCPLL